MNQPEINQNYHFIGAGGIGMSGLAKLLVKNGSCITGSDMEDSAVIQRLRHLGADITIGHSENNIPKQIEAVVISAAIKESNPELAFARKNNLKVYKYAEMLGQLMDRYSGIAVCGTHGKSTTSAWLAYIFEHANCKPSFIVGADIPQLGSSSGAGDSEFFIAEACEYDRSFLNLHPQTCVILNIEQDHLDYYKDINEIVAVFKEFAGQTRQNGIVIANGQDRNTAEVIKSLIPDKQLITFGLDWKCNFSAHNIDLVDGLYRFDVFLGGQILGPCRISLPGEHNILNALAVIAASVSAGLKAKTVLELMSGFKGIDRRLMLKADLDGITVLDDYAHHPTEIKASLGAIRQRYQPKQLWCIFQPHQYSRTRFLLDDFAESFKLADITIVPEIYFVRDTAESKSRINAQVLVDRICGQNCKVLFINDFDDIIEYLKQNVKSGDLVVTMGAGNIWKVADEYIQWLGKNS